MALRGSNKESPTVSPSIPTVRSLTQLFERTAIALDLLQGLVWSVRRSLAEKVPQNKGPGAPSSFLLLVAMPGAPVTSCSYANPQLSSCDVQDLPIVSNLFQQIYSQPCFGHSNLAP